jgi:hypothetical protein
VLLPGVGGFGEFDPGTVLGVVGVEVPPGGVAVPPEGVVVPPGAAWPADPAAPPGAAPPAGALCAITQTAQNRSVESKVSFAIDIEKASCGIFLCDPSKTRNHPDDSVRLRGERNPSGGCRRVAANILVAEARVKWERVSLGRGLSPAMPEIFSYWPVSVNTAGVDTPAAVALI